MATTLATPTRRTSTMMKRCKRDVEQHITNIPNELPHMHKFHYTSELFIYISMSNQTQIYNMGVVRGEVKLPLKENFKNLTKFA
jgi:hypothetical protein